MVKCFLIGKYCIFEEVSFRRLGSVFLKIAMFFCVPSLFSHRNAVMSVPHTQISHPYPAELSEIPSAKVDKTDGGDKTDGRQEVQEDFLYNLKDFQPFSGNTYRGEFTELAMRTHLHSPKPLYGHIL